MAARLPTTSDHRQHRSICCQSNASGQHAFDQQAHRDGKGGQLGRPADQQRDRRGRALVDVGHPHVEGHGAELEGQPGHDEHQPNTSTWC
jgi:hypothetical protein